MKAYIISWVGLGALVGNAWGYYMGRKDALRDIEAKQRRHLDWLRKNLQQGKCPTCGEHISIYGTEARCSHCGSRVERVPG